MSAYLVTLSARVQRLDRVVLAMIALLAALALAAPLQAATSLRFTLDALIEIAPYLALAVAFAAYAEAAGVQHLVARTFQGRTWAMILAAAVFGALSPFCSCGVIPLIGALLASGVPLSAVMAFWLASPIMDPEMFVLTAGGLGLDFALAKTAAAFGLGLLGGVAMLHLQRLPAFATPLKGTVSRCALTSLRGERQVYWAPWRRPQALSAMLGVVRGTGFFLLKWLALAFLLESLMLAYLPAEAVGRWVGGDLPFAVPLAALLGAPAYLNGYAGIPTAAALIDLGMTPAAALAFLVAGAVTSLPAAMAVFALVRAPVFLAYLGLGLAGAMLAGFGYQMLA